MATTKPIEIKLAIDKKANRVLYAEAGKDFVDFLLRFFSMPLANVMRALLTKDKNKDRMMGSLAELYESVQNLGDIYMIRPNQNKNSILKPKAIVFTSDAPFSIPNAAILDPSYYSCSSKYCSKPHVTVDPRYRCPQCSSFTSIHPTFFIPNPLTGHDCLEGFVKDAVTYMVMDNLAIQPLSTLSCMTLLSKFSIENFSSVEEMVVHLGMEEGLELLRSSLQSKTVLSDTFLYQKGSSSSHPTIKEEKKSNV